MFDKMSSWDRRIVIAVLSVAFVKLFLLHPTFSDESFYFNVARNIAEGLTPYKDFFFAHPPLQVYALAILYKIFGSSFLLGKILTLVSSSLSVLLLYTIMKQVCKDKSAFLSSLLFLVSPPFLAYSSISYGMWETMAFLLLSMLLLFRRKTFLSAVSFVAAVFFRYIAIIYLPLFLIVLCLRKGKISRFLLYLLPLISFSFLIMFEFFGMNYINQTLLYHISKISIQSQDQYFGMNMFFIFLAAVSALVGFFEENRLMVLFALFPLLLDILLLLSLKTTFYHYFLLSQPFYMIAFSKIFELRYAFLKIVTVAFLIVCLIINFKTLDFYLNPVYSKKFYYMVDFIESNTEKNDTIFGEPVATNYVSFVSGRSIAGNYLDSYLQHLVFEGTGKVVEELSEEKPKVIIEVESYYTGTEGFKKFIGENYSVLERVEGTPRYLIYKYKI